MSLPGQPLYDTAGIRVLEECAIEAGRLPSLELMERAGAAAFARLRSRWPAAKKLLVVCGKGNNGGDGYVVARLAKDAGLEVTVAYLTDPAALVGDAAMAFAKAQLSAVDYEPFHPELCPRADLVVDAVLGIGIKGAVRPPARQAIAAINGSGKPVLALDLPSGLDADTGAIAGGENEGTAIRAAATVTFLALKPGLLTGAAPDLVGELWLETLGIDEPGMPGHGDRDTGDPRVRRVTYEDFTHLLPPRDKVSHKNRFGHVLIVGGDRGFGGAVLLAAEAAVRTGAGLVTVASREQTCGALLGRRPEIMCRALDKATQLSGLGQQATVLVVGPGAGQDAWGQELIKQALGFEGPQVIDADAVNYLASEGLPAKAGDAGRRILTPHPGEAARLLDTDTSAIAADRLAAARQIARQFGGICVLKGAGTVIADDDGKTFIVTDGNPGMASAGMGDTLAGIIGALLAQGLGTFEAAALGVCLHARAGDLAARQGERGLLASDLMPAIRQLVNPDRLTP